MTQPNIKCFYERYVNDKILYPQFWHDYRDGKCYDVTCELIGKNPGKDPIAVISKEANKSQKQLFKEFMDGIK